MTSGDPRAYREHWAPMTGQDPKKVYTPVGIRRKLTQCEGCEYPLGHYLEDGYVMGDFEITWQNCLSHPAVNENMAVALPFDEYDDYNSPWI